MNMNLLKEKIGILQRNNVTLSLTAYLISVIICTSIHINNFQFS